MVEGARDITQVIECLSSLSGMCMALGSICTTQRGGGGEKIEEKERSNGKSQLIKRDVRSKSKISASKYIQYDALPLIVHADVMIVVVTAKVIQVKTIYLRT
jgi:hypothetical protein